MQSAEGGVSIPTLRPDDFVLFMKRLRKARPGKVRFLAAGEYGELGRPHFHALLFNVGFSDRVYLRDTAAGMPIYRSAELESLWTAGFSSVGDVTFASAGYVARYTLKKARQETSQGSGEPGGREPEFLRMSRRPGIGDGWFQKFKSDVFPHDEVILSGGARMKPPRFYSDRLRAEDPSMYESIKARRRKAARSETEGRLADVEEVSRRRVKDYLKRGL